MIDKTPTLIPTMLVLCLTLWTVVDGRNTLVIVCEKHQFKKVQSKFSHTIFFEAKLIEDFLLCATIGDHRMGRKSVVSG